MSIILSSNLETVGRKLIGLKLVLVLVGQFLGRDVTSAHFSSSGKVEGSAHTSEVDLRNLGGIFLWVVAFLGFKLLTSLSTVSGVTF